jgi:thioredoxin 2
VNRVPAAKDASAAKCGKCHKPLFTGRAVPATAETFPKHIRKSDIPVVVDFWAEWCGPCKMMAPVYEKVAAELEPRFRFLKVDTESEPALAAKYNIRSIPTLMLFKNGAVAAQRAGASDGQSLRNWLRQNA